MKESDKIKVKEGSSSVFEGEEGIIHSIIDDVATVKFDNNNESIILLTDLEIVETESIGTMAA